MEKIQAQPDVEVRKLAYSGYGTNVAGARVYSECRAKRWCEVLSKALQTKAVALAFSRRVLEQLSL